MMTGPIKFLIVDDEPDLRELLVLILGSQYNSIFYEAGSGKEAIEILESENLNMDFILSDFNMPHGNGATLCRFVRQKMPTIPFLLITSDDRRDHPEILSQPLTGYFEKPFDETRLILEIDRLFTLKPGLTETEVPQYMPISLHSLLRLKATQCPIFIKLSNNHFVKVLGEKESFDEAVLQRFTAKGVQYLYLHKDSFEPVLRHFRELVENDLYVSAMKAKGVETLQLSKSIQEMIQSATRTFGWNEQVLSLGNEGIKLVQSLVHHDSKLNDIFDWFKEDAHDAGILNSILLTYTLASLTRQLKLPNPRSLDYLSLAAFFHDLPLSDHLIKNQRKFLKAMQLGVPTNKEELDLIRKHSLHTKELLSNWPHCPKEVIRIIEQHMERPDGLGFPHGLKGTDMDTLAGTFIVAQEVVQLYLAHRDRDLLFSELSGMSALFGQQASATREPFAMALSLLSR